MSPFSDQAGIPLGFPGKAIRIRLYQKEAETLLDTSPPQSTMSQKPQLRDISGAQWRSGAAAWLGWMFDGLDMHLYTLVAAGYVAALAHVPEGDPDARAKMGYIQAAFLFGWAIGGGFFGRLGDILGRSKALILTILTYTLFTGLSCFATEWWHLLIFRFLAALGIGGEWAVGASLLSETWPARWRPWLAAVLQSGVNLGVFLATLAGLARTYLPREMELQGFVIGNFSDRVLFLVGLLPALLTLWIRKHVPETEDWTKAAKNQVMPGILDLFRGSIRRTTVLTILVCGFSLTAHWAFQFWSVQHYKSLDEIKALDPQERERQVVWAFMLINLVAVAGNFVAAWFANLVGYRKAIIIMCLGYLISMIATYGVVRDARTTFLMLTLMGIAQGVFGLFTMYLPPLFPVLLRTTGAGFCYNIGRIAAATGTIVFGVVQIEQRMALFYSCFLFIPAIFAALGLPEHPIEEKDPNPEPV